MKRFLLLIWLVVCTCASVAQETIVVGEIYDEVTGQPMPNVTIYLQGTQVGTTSNAEGLFLLRTHIDRRRTMIVSAVGYHTQRFHIEPGQQVGIDVAMREKVGNLGDVFVYPGENPALPLMERVRVHRARNDSPVSFENADVRTSLYVSDIQPKHLRRALWNSLRSGMIQHTDSSYLLPLYCCEQHGMQVSEQAAMLTTTDYRTLLSQLQSSFNFYRNNISVFSASLLSPLASSGSTYYHYYLIDSLLTNTEKHYIVHFKTKNAFYPTINGTLEIDSATYALRRVEATVPTQVNINYLRELTICQTFADNNQLQEENLSLILDFAIKADTTHTFPTLLLTRQTFLQADSAAVSVLPKPQPAGGDAVVSSVLDTLDQMPLFRFAKFCAYVIQTGYWPTRTPVEIGRLTETLKYSPQEGLRVGIPLRTTEDLWQNVSLEAFAAYGVRDRAWKGAGQMHVSLPSTRRHVLHLRYGDEYVYSDVSDFDGLMRENSVWSPQMSLVTNWLQGAVFNSAYYYNTASRRREGRMLWEGDWNDYLETRFYAKVGRMGYGQPTTDYAAQPSYFYATLGGSARVSFHERKIDLYFHRRHLYNHLPVVFLGAEVGSYRTASMSSYRMYGNIHLLLRQCVDLGVGGELNYALQAGLVLGRVPYPLLHIMAGNQTYTFDAERFTLMNNYQYAADRYITLHADWNGQGVLFNLIPGIRYLRLRELAEVKVAYGGLRQSHQSVLAYPTLALSDAPMLSDLHIPYVELGIGIGNILRIGEVYSIWRVTHINDPVAPYWTLRFRLKFGL